MKKPHLKVKELIEFLKNVNQEADVMINDKNLSIKHFGINAPDDDSDESWEESLKKCDELFILTNLNVEN